MENINNNTIENSKNNIVTKMKENNHNWSNNIGITNIFFQEAINKGGYRKNASKIC